MTTKKGHREEDAQATQRDPVPPERAVIRTNQARQRRTSPVVEEADHA